MKKVFIAAIMYLSVLTTNTFAEVKMGIILGFTGPIESLTPAMAVSYTHLTLPTKASV